MGKLISAARALGRSERDISKMKTARNYRKAITQDISSALGQIALMADGKAVETENFQAGEKLLQQSDSFQKIEDVNEFSWKNPKSWGKQEGYQYRGRQYDREQVMTLGESFRTYGAGFDESQKANLMSNWEKMNSEMLKDKSAFIKTPFEYREKTEIKKPNARINQDTSIVSSDDAYARSLERSNEIGDKNSLLADRQDEFRRAKDRLDDEAYERAEFKRNATLEEQKQDQERQNLKHNKSFSVEAGGTFSNSTDDEGSSLITGIGESAAKAVSPHREGIGLTEVANNRLYEADPSMLGKPAKERVARYEELFPFELTI